MTNVKPWAFATLALVITTGAAIAQPGKSDSAARGAREIAALSAEEAEALRLEYSAPASCPNAAQFLERVTAQSSRYRAAKPNELARVLHIDIVPVAGEMAGEARMLQASSPVPANFVTVGPCNLVVDRLAQFVLGKASTGELAAAPPRDGQLPTNPYLDWRGPIAESLPPNPYPRLMNDIGSAPALTAPAPTERAELTLAARNPYRW